jgi:hypothetical protein
MNDQKIKVPRRSATSKIGRAIGKAPKDGTWHKLAVMGPTTAEQTARSYNFDDSSWEFGWSQGVEKSEIVSFLWVRWVG